MARIGDVAARREHSSTPEPPRRPTLKDVAARAGVSKSLVSLVMRGAPQVSDRRRAAVLRAASELGYQPNAVARSLVQRRTHTVGVLLSDLHNPFVAEVVDGIDARVIELGYQPLLGNGRRMPHREEDLLEAFAGLRVEGLILLAPVVVPDVLRSAAARQPLVVVSRPDVRVPGVDSVVNDEAEGIRLAVDHLVLLGHKDIAHIAGDGSAAPERRQGYERAMRNRGLDDHIRVVPGGYAEQDGYEAARALLAADHLPTAVIVANDLAAMGVLTAIGEAGLRVPDDISVVGYDNTALAALRHISLTSVNQPRQEMGRMAADMLHERIEGLRSRAHRQVVTPTLVTRRSTGPVPQGGLADRLPGTP
jgi:DNA-binding LacI/PurR family transcriptional regulator